MWKWISVAAPRISIVQLTPCRMGGEKKHLRDVCLNWWERAEFADRSRAYLPTRTQQEKSIQQVVGV